MTEMKEKKKKSITGEQLSLLEKTGFKEHAAEFFTEMQVYQAGIREIRTKLEILDEEFRIHHDHNPIHHIESRLKSPQSIIQKLVRRGLEVNIESMRSELYDVAGVRVIVQYLDDVERVASLLLTQDDITLIKRSDYVTNPKKSGYRSLHLVVEVPVFLAEGKKRVPVEIQIRSIAMDFWASLEHRLKYKQSEEVPLEIRERLRDCAERIAAIDREMQEIYRIIMEEGDL